MAIKESDWGEVRWLLEALEDPFAMFPVKSVANSITKTLSESQETFDARMGPNVIARKFWDVQTELIHTEIGLLIGSAFVLGQVTISQTVTIFERLRLHAKNVENLPKNKDEILELDVSFDSYSGLSEMLVVDSVANYFKHHHEWSSDWKESSKKGVKARTIHNAKLIGMVPGDLTDNLYCALRRMHIEHTNVMQIAIKIQSWREKLARRLYLALDVPDPEEMIG